MGDLSSGRLNLDRVLVWQNITIICEASKLKETPSLQGEDMYIQGLHTKYLHSPKMMLLLMHEEKTEFHNSFFECLMLSIRQTLKRSTCLRFERLDKTSKATFQAE